VGGAKFHVPDPPTLNRLYPGQPIHGVWDAAVDDLPSVPIDGTVVGEEASVYRISGEKKTPDLDGDEPAVTLWRGALAQVP
jgi:hypothetical protein